MFGGLRQILDAEPEMKDVHREGIQIKNSFKVLFNSI
jgi:hypothetical protein